MRGEAIPTFDADEQMMWNNLPLSEDERVAAIFAVRVVRKADNVHLCQAAERRDLRLSLAVLTCATLILMALRPCLAASLVIFSLPADPGLTRSPPIRPSL